MAKMFQNQRKKLKLKISRHPEHIQASNKKYVNFDFAKSMANCPLI